jgi:hypothetical protein
MKIHLESYDLVVLISGPEPQGTILGTWFQSGKIQWTRGVNQRITGKVIPRNSPNNISFFNHLPTDKLNQLLLKAKLLLAGRDIVQ